MVICESRVCPDSPVLSEGGLSRQRFLFYNLWEARRCGGAGGVMKRMNGINSFFPCLKRDARKPLPHAFLMYKDVPSGGFEHGFEIPNKNRKDDGRAQNVGNAFRIEQAVSPVAEPGEDEAERKQDDEFAHHGSDEGELGAPQRHERPLAGIEDADEHHAPEVYAYGGDGDFDEPLGIGERHDEGLGEEHDEPACNGGKAERKGQNEEEDLFYAFGFARAEVIAHDGHGALAQAVHREAQKLLDAEHDGQGADIIVVAVLLHPGVHDQGDEAVRHLDEERGKAEQDDGHKLLEVQPQVLPAETQNRALAEE